MFHAAIIFLACILAGFALIQLPGIAFVSGLLELFDIIGVLAIVVFSLALLFLGVKLLLSKKWY